MIQRVYRAAEDLQISAPYLFFIEGLAFYSEGPKLPGRHKSLSKVKIKTYKFL
jgi:hypothetical protein